jgi:hypothetical protein
VIQARRLQRSFGDGLIAVDVKDLHDARMPHVDAILADDEIIAAVHQALAQRHPNSRRRGRLGFSAEVVLRLLVLKHLRTGAIRCWSARCAPILCIATSPASAAIEIERLGDFLGNPATGGARPSRPSRWSG